MGKVNDALCSLLEVAEYFADFWNGTRFWGEYSLKEECLYRDGKEYYKRLERKASIRRDILMKCKGRLNCILGIEISDSVDYTLPARIMDYNSQEIKRQLNDIAIKNRRQVEMEQIGWEHGGEFMYGVRKEDKILPVLTVGLYCGWEAYDGTDSVLGLSDMNGIPYTCKGMFTDYPVQLYTLRDLDETRFETGLRELIAVFKRSRSRTDMKFYYLQNKERFARLDDFLIDAMAALIGDDKIKLFKQEGRGLDLCKAFEDERNEGIEIGIDSINNLIQYLIRDGRSDEILTIVSDKVYQKQVLREYGLA